MKHIIRLLIALVIALIAAMLNWMWMSRERSYPEYVCVSEPIKEGERIDKNKLKPVQVKGDPEVLANLLVPWGQKELWYDRFASRDYHKDQPLFQRDMEESPTAREWDTLGPFMLVGVGNEVSAQFSEKSGSLIPVSGNILTLAIDDSQKTEKSLLYRYLAAMRGEYYFNETTAERNLLKIIGVEPRVSGKAKTGGGTAAAAADAADRLSAASGSDEGGMSAFAGQRLIFVSLENIPNTPSWLRIGEEIYFMVPPGKQKLLASTPPDFNAGDDGPK